MTSKVDLIFLGTGGGRFTTITQKRRTAGIRVISHDLNLHLDPGPGGLIHSIEAGLDPEKLNAVFVSHCHPDHYNDAEVLIEAMTHGMTKKGGTLVAPKSVLRGSDDCESSVSRYHQQIVDSLIEAVPGLEFSVGRLNVDVTEARHTDSNAVGFRFKTEDYGHFAYTSDTEFFDEIAKYYAGVRLLIMCVMRPGGKPWKGHMTSDDAVKILNQVRPEVAVLTHLGLQMIFKGPDREAEYIQKQTGVRTTAATDGMKIAFGSEIAVEKSPGKQVQQEGKLNRFF